MVEAQLRKRGIADQRVLRAMRQIPREEFVPQELRVLRLLVAGRSNRDIAAEQIVSINTIRTQVQSIYRKLGVNNRVAACEMARQVHLL